jgi:hypothetical protein
LICRKREKRRTEKQFQRENCKWEKRRKREINGIPQGEAWYHVKNKQCDQRMPWKWSCKVQDEELECYLMEKKEW